MVSKVPKNNLANSEENKKILPKKTYTKVDKSGLLKTDKSTRSAKNAKQPNLNELERLYVFMQKYRNETGKGKNLPWTHAMTFEPFGSYNIPDDMTSKFMKLYEDAIVAGFQPHITERHKDYGPIVIDIDFVQEKEKSKRYYTDVTIRNIIKLYNMVIKQYLEIQPMQLDAYVCEKKEPTLRKNQYHDGIHIMYPHICTRPSLQMKMREDFLKMAEENNIFKKIPLVNSLAEVFDQNVIYHTGWLLYGSRKNTHCKPYMLTHIYNVARGKIYDTLIPGDQHTRGFIRHLISTLSIRKYSDEKDSTPLAIDIEELENKINKMTNKIIESANNKREINNLMGDNINFIKAVPEDLLVEAKNLVKLFSKGRATEWHKWYQVGRCLHNIDYRLLEDWIKFSKKCPEKFKQGECEALWKKMKPSNYTMASLHYFASTDNPEKYLTLKEEKLNKLIQNGLEASHRTIANLLMEKYKFIYKCASIKHNIWYEYRNHRWIEIDSAYSLRNLISDELTIEYGKKQSYLYDKSKGKQGFDRERCINEATHISKVIKQLNTSTFKNGVIRECADIAYDPNFLKNLDENIYLIGFENGIYDLEADIFRDGCPDDYISLCTNYNYVPFDENDECAKQVNCFLGKIQVVQDIREYLLKLLSTCLAGSISEENFYVFTGSGANGKSKLMELLKYTLGDYFKPMDIRLLTEKRASSSSASPEVADKKGIRACPFDEPKATDEINTGFMKIFTGGDVITARALFKEPIYFKPQFKPFLLCNHLPNIKSDDDGTWRRLKVLPFESKFVKPSEATKTMKKDGLPERHFWADNSLSEQLPEWKQAFMGMLLKYYRKYRLEGLIHPKLVTTHTQEYRKRCDVFQDFLGDLLEKTNDPQHSISTLNLHDSMRSWYRANYEGKCPNTKDLRNYLQKRLDCYVARTDSIVGYRIKQGHNEEIVDDLDRQQ